MEITKDTVVLITGGNKGIGKATADLFAEMGAQIIFTTRTDNIISCMENLFKSRGASKVKGYLFDITDLSACKELSESIKKEFGRLDILINNAGIGIFKSAMEMTPEDWNNVIQTNLTGVFHLTQELLPIMMEQQRGHIVNVGSLASRNTFAGGSAYCASKFGLLGYSECLMLDVRDHNIKVSIIMPGSVNTPFNNHSPEDDDETWKLTASDVAEAIYDVVRTRSGHLMSRVELRPLTPKKKP